MPNKDKRYSVSQLSQVAGVSIRTLHYYDEIGLLVAHRRPHNGYREYSAHDAACLQQILIYRDLDMSLDQIKTIMTAKDYDLMNVLHKQKALLHQRLLDTKSMINRIEVTMSAIKGEKNIDILFEGLPSDKAKVWKESLLDDPNGDKVLEAYGNLSEEEMSEETRLANEWTMRYVDVVGQPITLDTVQHLVIEAFELSNRMFYKTELDGSFEGISYAMYLDIVDATKNDPVMRDMYNHYAPGFADHLHEAMLYFAENELKHNEEKYRTLM